MTRAILIGLLLLGFASCKSIKKTKLKESTSFALIKSAAVVDSAFFSLKEIAKEVEEVETVEVIEQTFVSLDSSGITIFKPVTVTRKTTKSTKTADTTKNETEIKVDANRTTEQSESSAQSKDLDKASESEVIGQALDAIFPKWGKILASILMALVPVLWGIWKKRNQKEEI